MTIGFLGTDWLTWAGILFLIIFSAAIYLGWYFFFEIALVNILLVAIILAIMPK